MRQQRLLKTVKQLRQQMRTSIRRTFLEVSSKLCVASTSPDERSKGFGTPAPCRHRCLAFAVSGSPPLTNSSGGREQLKRLADRLDVVHAEQLNSLRHQRESNANRAGGSVRLLATESMQLPAVGE